MFFVGVSVVLIAGDSLISLHSDRLCVRVHVCMCVCSSTCTQVAIKSMLKKYLFSDAEKASVEREIEIQQVHIFFLLCLPDPSFEAFA